jgi:hypothetical protein
VSIRHPFAIATGSRAQTFAMPVATTARSLEPSSQAEWLNASRLVTLSGIQIAG